PGPLPEGEGERKKAAEAIGRLWNIGFAKKLLLDRFASSEFRGRCRRRSVVANLFRLTSARLAVADGLARMPPVLWLDRLALFSGCRRGRIHPFRVTDRRHRESRVRLDVFARIAGLPKQSVVLVLPSEPCITGPAFDRA